MNIGYVKDVTQLIVDGATKTPSEKLTISKKGEHLLHKRRKQTWCYAIRTINQTHKMVIIA